MTPLIDLHTVLVLGHIIGTAFGVGGATVSDLLFFRALKDGKMEKSEWALLKTASLVLWMGIILIIASGTGFILDLLSDPNTARFATSPRILLKMTLAGIILVNGIILHWKVFPIFASLRGGKVSGKKFKNNATLIFTTGAVSIVSWYSAMVLGVWRGVNTLGLTYQEMLAGYGVLLLVAVVVANIIGRVKTKPKKR